VVDGDTPVRKKEEVMIEMPRHQVEEAQKLLSSLAVACVREQVNGDPVERWVFSTALRLRFNECARALTQALNGDPVRRWVLTQEERPVNAFVSKGAEIPAPEEYEVGYSLAVGDIPRLRIEVAGV
jgi:hypothetical protein